MAYFLMASQALLQYRLKFKCNEHQARFYVLLHLKIKKKQICLIEINLSRATYPSRQLVILLVHQLLHLMLSSYNITLRMPLHCASHNAQCFYLIFRGVSVKLCKCKRKDTLVFGSIWILSCCTQNVLQRKMHRNSDIRPTLSLVFCFLNSRLPSHLQPLLFKIFTSVAAAQRWSYVATVLFIFLLYNHLQPVVCRQTKRDEMKWHSKYYDDGTLCQREHQQILNLIENVSYNTLQCIF